MGKPDRNFPVWKILTVRLLHPVAVFFLVTFISALVYAVPNLRESYRSSSTSIFGLTSLLLNIFLPLFTGLIAATGAYFGLSDLRRKVGNRYPLVPEDEPYTRDARFRAIARHLPTGVITFDPEGRVTFANPAAKELFHELSPSSDDAIESFFRTGLRGSSIEKVFDGESLTVEENLLLSGRPERDRYLQLTGIPITRQDQIVEALFLIEDRTRYRRLEDELIRSEDRYRNIFNHAPCGIFFVDSNGHYLDANPAALQMLGYTLEELTNLSTRELSAGSDRRLRRLRETPGWIAEETRYLRKDGKVVETELQASSYQSGNDTYFIGITRDVTSRNELERNLAAAKARLRAVLSLESRPLILLDVNDQVSNLNTAAQELLNCTAEKLMGVPLRQLIEGEPPPLQETTSASLTSRVFKVPGNPPVNLSVMRLPLGQPAESGSLLLVSSPPVKLSGSN